MVNYGIVQSRTAPKAVEIAPDYVYIASNITYHDTVMEDVNVRIYEYEYTQYTKDEYISYMAKENEDKITALEEELQATKILLGVE